ncbi:MFS transporter, partial [Burkholderia multivorans]|uniref:MFS transporter n=1 Tax=Burkholderia multivorans TaxID=87883 RepID=UPI001C24610F
MSDELKRWRLLCYLQACLALEAFSAPVLVFFYTSYAGFTFAEYSSIISLIFVFLWVLEIPTGAFADRYGRKLALVTGNVVYFFAMYCLLRYGHQVAPWQIAFLFACGGGSSSFRVEHNTHNAPLVVEPGGHVCRPLAGLCTCPRGVFE